MSIDHVAGWSPDPEWVGDQLKAIAYVSEGFCPNDHGQLVDGAHDRLYGYCPECDLGWSAYRLPAGSATVATFFPDTVIDGVVVGPADPAMRYWGDSLPWTVSQRRASATRSGVARDPLPW